jgi:hypothetical protein
MLDSGNTLETSPLIIGIILIISVHVIVIRIIFNRIRVSNLT